MSAMIAIVELLVPDTLDRYPEFEDPDTAFLPPEDPPMTREERLVEIHRWLDPRGPLVHELILGECVSVKGRTFIPVLVRAVPSFLQKVPADGEIVIARAVEEAEVFHGVGGPYFVTDRTIEAVTGDVARSILADPENLPVAPDLRESLAGPIAERMRDAVGELLGDAGWADRHLDDVREATDAVLDGEDLGKLSAAVLQDYAMRAVDELSQRGLFNRTEVRS